MITNQKKPYSIRPAVCEHDQILEKLKPYLIGQEVGIKQWPSTITKDNHKVMNRYQAKREVAELLIKWPNIFLSLQYHYPEDISFYRGEHSWFYTSSHEKDAFLDGMTKEDIKFFEKYYILEGLTLNYSESWEI